VRRRFITDDVRRFCSITRQMLVLANDQGVKAAHCRALEFINSRSDLAVPSQHSQRFG
jgi:hypothetical protein